MICCIPGPLQLRSSNSCVHCTQEAHFALCFAGFCSSKAAVPIRERSQQAWFVSPQQHALPARMLDAMPAPLGLQAGGPGYLQDLWSPSFECFQQVMGGVNVLRQVSQDSLHSDISQREVSQMCGIAEHSWYLLRQQHSSLHDGCEQLCVLEHSVELLDSTAAHALDCFRSKRAQEVLQYASQPHVVSAE